MESDSNVQRTPFVKHLAASDKPTREKALSSLQTYLTSNRTFTNLELLKIWKGLFFCIFHTDRPVAQTHLSQRLSSLLLTLPNPLFIPFLSAFYTTVTAQFSQIPSLRLDKYLYLIRRYVSSAFTYLSLHSWPLALIGSYFDLMQGPVGPLSRGVGDEAKVPDGLRYHVLDVWTEELMSVLENGAKEASYESMGETLMAPVRSLAREGRTKMLKKKAAESMRQWDERHTGTHSEAASEGQSDEWEGLGD